MYGDQALEHITLEPDHSSLLVRFLARITILLSLTHVDYVKGEP